MKKLLLILTFFCLYNNNFCQQLNSAEIRLALEKLRTLGSVLYIAAHPDDENTRLITYLSKERKVRTGYLSLTRGDGGQNLIGTEKGALMGVLRTQELLEARKIDGGEQFFTRAVDFGYSKTAKETFEKWNKEAILSDVVWIIRKFKPDVIVTRFPPNEMAGHGHHMASAILAEEAFDLAGDPNSFPEQLQHVSIWEPKRLLFNSSSWWDQDLPDKVKKTPNKFIIIDVGKYSPLLGKSYTEIAAESRTMHKSQGFGSRKQKGSTKEYLILVKGDTCGNNILKGVSTSWKEVEDGMKIDELLSKALKEFDETNPTFIVPTLLNVYRLINLLPENNRWKKIKLAEARDLITSCLGLFVEATASDFNTTNNHATQLIISALNRSNLDIRLSQLTVEKKDTTVNLMLQNNIMDEIKTFFHSYDIPISHPYWLRDSFEETFSITNQEDIGLPEAPPALNVIFHFLIEGVKFSLSKPVNYKWTDRVKGELHRPFVVLPKVTANIDQNIYLFTSSKAKKVKVALKAHEENQKGNISLDLSEGWSCKPNNISFDLVNKGDEKIVDFLVTPPTEKQIKNVRILDQSKNTMRTLTYIEYDHIKSQTLLFEAKAKFIKTDLSLKSQTIGYIMGSGDDVPESLKQLGCQVDILEKDDIRTMDLTSYDAIISGIRAYNVNKHLFTMHDKLMKYVQNGGNLIIQYNTNRGLDTKRMAPFPLKLSRLRVTDERSEVTFLSPDHPVLNVPNKIENSDFDGWVQERGLYFPSEWDENYTPILGWNDPGEEMTKGSLLVSHYGEGNFIYTGISFFRQLPAGVPGAYKLLANMISYGK